MKSNDPQKWTIQLHGVIDPVAPKHAEEVFTGTIEEVLGRADEMECEVDFDVHQIVITRAARANGHGQPRARTENTAQ